MDITAFQAIGAMLNSFPQTGANPDLTMASIEEALDGVSSQTIIDAAKRFIAGDVPHQHKTFAPSVAEFVQEVRRTPDKQLMRLSGPSRDHYRPPSPESRIRMGFKMSVLSAGLARSGGADMVAEANKDGLEGLMAIAQTWGVPIPEALWTQSERRAG